MGLIQYYQITCQPVNKAIYIFIIMPILFCNLVSIKCIIVLFTLTFVDGLRVDAVVVGSGSGGQSAASERRSHVEGTAVMWVLGYWREVGTAQHCSDTDTPHCPTLQNYIVHRMFQ